VLLLKEFRLCQTTASAFARWIASADASADEYGDWLKVESLELKGRAKERSERRRSTVDSLELRAKKEEQKKEVSKWEEKKGKPSVRMKSVRKA
jgi:hypothetical protein